MDPNVDTSSSIAEAMLADIPEGDSEAVEVEQVSESDEGQENPDVETAGEEPAVEEENEPADDSEAEIEDEEAETDEEAEASAETPKKKSTYQRNKAKMARLKEESQKASAEVQRLQKRDFEWRETASEYKSYAESMQAENQRLTALLQEQYNHQESPLERQNRELQQQLSMTKQQQAAAVARQEHEQKMAQQQQLQAQRQQVYDKIDNLAVQYEVEPAELHDFYLTPYAENQGMSLEAAAQFLHNNKVGRAAKEQLETNNSAPRGFPKKARTAKQIKPKNSWEAMLQQVGES